MSRPHLGRDPTWERPPHGEGPHLGETPPREGPHLGRDPSGAEVAQPCVPLRSCWLALGGGTCSAASRALWAGFQANLSPACRTHQGKASHGNKGRSVPRAHTHGISSLRLQGLCLSRTKKEQRWFSEGSGNSYAPGSGVQTLKGSSFGEESSFCRAGVSPPVTPDGLAV